MKELDEIRQTHKRSVARRAAKLAGLNPDATGATVKPITKNKPAAHPILIPKKSLSLNNVFFIYCSSIINTLHQLHQSYL